LDAARNGELELDGARVRNGRELTTRAASPAALRRGQPQVGRPVTPLEAAMAPAVRYGLAETVADRLRETILHGYFAPDERLREEHLAELLQVSRGPVREALTQLEREGLVVIRPNRGASVARLSTVDLEEVYSLRLVLERLAVQYAVRRATDEDFAAMDRVMEALETAVARGITTQETAALDTGFHDLIYQASHHQRLIDAWAMLRSQLYLFLLTRIVDGMRFREEIVAKHARILAALKSRDEARATDLIDSHIRSSYPLVRKRTGAHQGTDDLPASIITAPLVGADESGGSGVTPSSASGRVRRASRRGQS
jgi:DNA-binding GntR family transcriptional regulator